MNLDWSVVWTHRQALLDGALLTVSLTVLTMALAVPGGSQVPMQLLPQPRGRSLCHVMTLTADRNAVVGALLGASAEIPPALIEHLHAAATVSDTLSTTSPGPFA